MADLALDVRKAVAQRRLDGGLGRTTARTLASGDGWSAADEVCTAGPADRPFEERHAGVSIAIVVAGSFQYRSGAHGELMTPGSLFLGSPGQAFECGHEHGEGDRCISFRYDESLFERIVAESGSRRAALRFDALRVPPVRATASLIGEACARLLQAPAPSWEELSLQMIGRVWRLLRTDARSGSEAPPSVLARVTRTMRLIEEHLQQELPLRTLAQEARLSPYHFLRTFQRVTGLTPHQYIRRARLRQAAASLGAFPHRVSDLALDAGFGDVSNFNHAFRAEFGVSPRRYRKRFART